MSGIPPPPDLTSVPAGMPRGVLPPVFTVAIFGLLALLAASLGLREAVTAAIALGYTIAVATIHPLNGLTVLALSIPFFLGEPRRPVFLIFDGLILIALLSWGLHALIRRWGWPRAPYALPLTMFILTSILAVPLNATELFSDLWVYSPAEWVAQTISTSTQPNVYFLRVLYSLLTAVCLFVMAANLSSPRYLAALAWAFVPLTLILCIAGVLRQAKIVSFGQGYLSLSAGIYPIRLTSIAWNPDYFAQYIILVLPLVLVVISGASSHWRLGFGISTLAIATFSLALTYQRAAYVAYLILALATVLLWLRVWTARGAQAPRRQPWLLAGIVLAAPLALVAVDLLLNIGLLGRFQEIWVSQASPHRPHIWRTAVTMMLDKPILGVGTGRFSYFFPEYSTIPPRSFGPFWGTAHSLYLQIASERGVLGLLAFSWMILTALAHGWRAARATRTPSDPTGFLLAGLLAWLGYGVFQSLFYIHSVEVLFWLLAGFMAACARHQVEPHVPRWAWPVAIAILLAGAGMRIQQATSRPLSATYIAGFYRWERQPDQTLARWMGRRSALAVAPKGTTLVLDLSVPTPTVALRPQKLNVWVGGRHLTEVTLTDPHWKTVRIAVGLLDQEVALVTFRAAYTFTPRDEGLGADSRRLGVMLKQVRWE